MYTNMKLMKSLSKELFGLAWHLRRCARRRGNKTIPAYEITYRGVVALARDVLRCKPKRAKRQVDLQFGSPTLGALTEKHLGPVQDFLTARAYHDEEILHYLWPNPVTFETYWTYSKGMKIRGESLPGPEGDALYLLADAIWFVAKVLLPSEDYRKPDFCNVCYRHTDPDSRAEHCPTHARAGSGKPNRRYKQGRALKAVAATIIETEPQCSRFREFVGEMQVARYPPDTDWFLDLVQGYCPLVWKKFAAYVRPQQSLFEVVSQLGKSLDDLYAAEWAGAMERRLKRILPERKFNPSKTQIIDPEEIERRMNSLLNDVTVHLCIWLVGAEAYLQAQMSARKKGRPRDEASRSALVRRLLAEGGSSRQEIAQAARVSIGLVHRIARLNCPDAKENKY